MFSGFIVDVSGEWFYITAGHILRDIRTALATGSSFDIWRLDDQTASNQFNGIAVPYEFDLEVWLAIYDGESGLDYAAVHLDGLYRKQLEAGGIIAIEKNSWGDHVTEYDYWVLIGIPSESVNYDEKTIITAKIVMSPLVEAEEPLQAGVKAQNQFYAKPADNSESIFKNADGLSGAPVFLLKKVDEQWKYKLIGVQSAWYESTKILAICPFYSLGLELERIIAEARRADWLT